MFYDLNVLWAAQDPELPRTLAFLSERYNVVALNHVIAGKLPAELACPIPDPLPFPTPAALRLLRRCTVTLSDPSHNHRLPALRAHYDLVAARPTDERTLQQACTSLDVDLVSLDLTVRYPFHFKMRPFAAAVDRGVRIELCYSPGLAAGDAAARRNLISNATGLIRATRGRGLVISSEARAAVACRGPWDVVNLTVVWGLAQERGREAVGKEARSVVVHAGLKQSSYRGVVDVVYGGEKPLESTQNRARGGQDAAGGTGKKRKAGDGVAQDQPLSKREMKRREKAKLAARNAQGDDVTMVEATASR